MDLHTLFMLRFEIILCIILFVMLVMRLLDMDKRPGLFLYIANTFLLINFALSFLPIESGTLFQDFFRTNDLVVLEKTLLSLGVLIISLQSGRWLMRHSEICIEFYLLMISSLIGCFLMLSSGHVLMLYIGIEMSTIPLAALSNFNKAERRSSEAAIKFILSSAFSSGIMLFGISMLYGAYGNLDFRNLQEVLEPNLLTIVAFSFMMGGFFFKMSAAPFHFWAADVYEGAPTPVSNYLSVISKGSIVFVFVSILVTVFENMRTEWQVIINIIAILSMTIGNLFAMRQTNMKRLLAFSSISQVGFILVGMTGNSVMGVDSTLYFMLIYIFSNISAFGIVGIVSDAIHQESIDSYKGFYKTNPFLAVVLAISFFSLAGVPPTAGFFGKLFLLTSAMGDHMYVLIAFAGINLVLSLYTYMRVIRRIFVDEPERYSHVKQPPLMATALVACASLVLIIGFIAPVFQYIADVGMNVFK